jgi:hypothetical protein
MQDDDGNWLLPDEILEKILKFVPENKHLILTCKKLYSTICQIEKNYRVLRVNSDLVRELILKKILFFKQLFLAWNEFFFSYKQSTKIQSICTG